MLDLSSTTMGFLVPRMTTAQRNAIAAPAVSLLIYNTTVNCFEWWTGTFWQVYTCTCMGPPPSPATPTGPVSLCAGSMGTTYSVTPVPGATSYTWTVPSGATIASGQGTNIITVNWGATSGNVCVTAINSCGGSAPSCVAVTVYTLPGAPGPIVGPLNPAINSVNNSYTVAPVPGATSYTWSINPSGATIASGQGTNAILANFGPAVQTYTICVNASNICGTGPTTCLAVTTITCPGVTLDQFAIAGSPGNCGNTTFTITTTNPSEMIMVAYDGWNGPGAGPVTVDGINATWIQTANNGNSGSAMTYAYVAPAAGVHTIVCATTGWNSCYYNNYAASFKGCAAMTVAGNIGINVINTIACQTGGSITATIATALPGSVIYANCEINEGQPTSYPISWTGATFLGDTHTQNGIDASQAYEPAPTVGNYTITATNASPSANGCGGLTLVLVVIHP